MADHADEASQLEELNLRVAFNNLKKPPPYRGFCLNCEDPLPAPMVFCDKDCGDDYSRRTINAANPD